MEKTQKVAFVDAFTEKARTAKLMIVTDHTGMTANTMTELRKQVAKVGETEFHIVKNTLARRAVAGSEIEGATAFLKGPSSVLMTTGDVVQAAKVLKQFRKDHKDALPIKGGVVDGKVVTVEQIKALADLPSKEVMQSMLLSVLNGPSRNLVSVLANVNRSILNVLTAYKNKLEEGE